MASLLELLRQDRSTIGRIDRATRQQLQAAYEVALANVEREIARGEYWISVAQSTGEPVSMQWLQRQAWYRQLEADIEREMLRFSDQAGTILANGQAASLTVAANTTAQIATMFQGRVNAPAFARWVSAMQPGTPVRRVIDGYGERVSESVLRRMTEGMGSGQGSRTITRKVMGDVGTDAVEHRIATLTRTEALRAYRGGLQDALQPMERDGIIVGYRWTASLSARTCIACIGMHGQVFSYYPMSQHPACRCVVSPVIRPDLVPGGRTPMTGDEWFARQDEATQRRMMPSAGHYEAYQDGTPPSQMVGIRRSRTWGDNVVIRPARELRRRDAA